MNKIERYCVRPNLNLVVGKKITKDTKFDEYNEDKSIHQILDNLVLTTIIDKEYEQAGCKVKEYSKTEVTYPDGTILIWNEQVGYIMPQIEVCTLDDVQQNLDEMNGVYKGE